MSFNYTLSADGQTTAVRAEGTVYAIEAEGTWGSGTLTPQVRASDGTYVTLGTSTLTANGRINVEIARGDTIRADLSGSTSPSLNVRFIRIRN